jgi:hypothetical protein
MNIFGKPEFWYTVTLISVAFIIYFLSQNKKSGKRLILKLYLANQTLSLSIQKDLEGFIEKHNAFNSIAFPEKNITYGHMLEQMKAEFEVNLSESLYQKLKKKNLSKPEIEVAIDSLNKQNEALRLVDLDMKLVIRKADSSLN